MVLILDGKSEIVAHVRSNLCYLICFGHLIRSRACTNRIFFPPKSIFPFIHAQHVLSSGLFGVGMKQVRDIVDYEWMNKSHTAT